MSGFHPNYDRVCRRVCGAGFSIPLKGAIYFEHFAGVNLSRTVHYRFNLVMKFPRCCICNHPDSMKFNYLWIRLFTNWFISVAIPSKKYRIVISPFPHNTDLPLIELQIKSVNLSCPWVPHFISCQIGIHRNIPDAAGLTETLKCTLFDQTFITNWCTKELI
jgi:hypothetical protein